jgi:hypothetical protein
MKKKMKKVNKRRKLKFLRILFKKVIYGSKLAKLHSILIKNEFIVLYFFSILLQFFKFCSFHYHLFFSFLSDLSAFFSITETNTQKSRIKKNQPNFHASFLTLPCPSTNQPIKLHRIKRISN